MIASHALTRVSSFLYIAISPKKGRGVFTSSYIRAGEVIEVCPVLLFNNEDDAHHIEVTPLANYYYRWDDERNAFVLGYGSLYNHSYKPNAYYRRNYTEQTMEFIALRDIQEGEEILINYNGHPNCMDPLWFPGVEEPSL